MKIVIIGGGFAGLKLARSLNNKKGFEITLIDKFNFHQFQPLFYQVATAGLDASNISFPLRKVFHKSKNVRIRLAEVQSIDAEKNLVMTNIGLFEYDHLVIATGADTNFFGNTVLQKNAFAMKSTIEALQIKYKILQNIENALVLKDATEIENLLTVVVVGGGPTGVEISGALAEMKKYVLPKDYPELNFATMKIYLLEGTGRTLVSMSEKSSKHSLEYLQKLGVIVKTNALLQEYDGKIVKLKDGSKIQSNTVIWAAGIKGNVPEGIDTNLIVRGNRIKVDRYNKVLNQKNIYALGDVAYMETPLYPNGHPQVANVAINQAKVLAKNFLKIQSFQQNLDEFEYNDKGSMATVGRNLAVVDFPKPKMHFKGFIAWYIWMGLHLFLLVGVKNRIQVFINWIYNYLTYDQDLRLIFKNPTKNKSK
ncbi:MAG: NAD(P)/FAD-dependent oxidoreductase [Chitinophagaceae bacterium]|nr:NAD(P)/FAD-dependent oxidoreductase [Chitinophagaceae bacterium]MCW5905423.1 NAD(P)/FAD-dependent oxidoreductase [Chitinophagaceae bacterium]